MVFYYVKLAILSFKRNPILSLLMVLAIAFGIGALMTTITVNYLMSNNPIKAKSDVLYHIQLDSWSPYDAARGADDPPLQVTWTDANNLQSAKQAYRQAAMARSGGIIQPTNPDVKAFQGSFRLTYTDFFPMFNVPFIYGAGWEASADENAEHVVVLSRDVNDRVFGGENSVGESLTIAGEVFQVVGVINDWHPVPKFFDLNTGDFGGPADVFMPLALKLPMELPSWGNTNCWKPPEGSGFVAFLNSECVNYQFWVELTSPQDEARYHTFLDGYVEQQKALGRFPRPLNNRMSNVQEWLEYNEVVADDAQIMMWLSMMFLLVCLLNTIGLMLSKFIGKSGEIGLRRAVGATRGDLFVQHLVETACIGMAGGLLGLLFSYFGLQGIRTLYGEFADKLTTLDTNMMLLAIAISTITTIVAGIYPTWRASAIAPAGQLKG